MDPPFIDHVSLTAASAQIEELGFHLSPISGSGSCARVFFDGTYFEVVSPRGTESAALDAQAWFLRPVDPDEAAEVLRSATIPAVGPDLYEGDDGTWLDVAIKGGSPVLPILTLRVDKPAHEWPPSLGFEHANGTTRISVVHLEAGDPNQVSRVLKTLGARAENAGTFALGGGGRVVVQQSQDGREGIIAIDLDRGDRRPLRLQVSPPE